MAAGPTSTPPDGRPAPPLGYAGNSQAKSSYCPADVQVHRVTCGWLPPGTEPRPSWGEPPSASPPARVVRCAGGGASNAGTASVSPVPNLRAAPAHAQEQAPYPAPGHPSGIEVLN